MAEGQEAAKYVGQLEAAKSWPLTEQAGKGRSLVPSSPGNAATGGSGRQLWREALC